MTEKRTQPPKVTRKDAPSSEETTSTNTQAASVTPKLVSGLRRRLFGTVLIAFTPPLVVMYSFEVEAWVGFLVGLLALTAAWYGGEKFILRRLRVLLSATERLAAGDWSSRTGMTETEGELGKLAQTFDCMAESLEERAREQEKSEVLLLNRAQQQATVAAIGQFALVNQDFNALLHQALHLVGDTLEIQIGHILELQSDHESLVVRAGLGWKANRTASNVIEARGRSQAAFVLAQRDPVIISNMRHERRFVAPNVLLDHGVASGVCLQIATRSRPFGMLGVYTTKTREFTGEEVQFLMAVANLLGMAAERRWTERDLQKLAAFAQLNPNPAMELTHDGDVTYFNDAALRLALSMEQSHPAGLLPANLSEIIQTSLNQGEAGLRHQERLGGRTLSWSFYPVPGSPAVHCYVEDVTERLSLESQLRQSQKMESIGQLAAGVAHDFNNMLSIIQGHAGLLLSRPDMPPQGTESAQAVLFASERAASLTRQLLMFSRKNVIQLQHLDLRDLVANMNKMLHRLLGETITLNYAPPATLPLVEGDAGMIEQVIMNLAVNARDAMEHGGTLTISLRAIEVADEYASTHPEANTGPHVNLRISDTGCGMDSYLISRIFEPFFTTKEVGKGTGLGLATVYGIVKQHNGWLEVTSQTNCGTVFDVFFPVCLATLKTDQEEPTPNPVVTGGNETILVAEDEPVLREMAQLILEECGYRVLVAGNGKEALEIWHRHRDRIDLLFTDLVMPAGMSGVDLAASLLGENPNLKIAFASGYTVNEISTDFLTRNNHARFLQKPYNRPNLARTIREALDGGGYPQRTGRPAAGENRC